MSDLLIRKIAPHMKRELQERARTHGRSLSDEVKVLLQEALQKRPAKSRKVGTELFSLIKPEHRGDDLVFEIPGAARRPPEFE
jgi:plasmid stability protein